MAGVTEATIASLLRHSGTALVRRYAHLSPSYLQEAVEKVSTFGKSTKESAVMPASTTLEPQEAVPAETTEAVSVEPDLEPEKMAERKSADEQPTHKIRDCNWFLVAVTRIERVTRGL